MKTCRSESVTYCRVRGVSVRTGVNDEIRFPATDIDGQHVIVLMPANTTRADWIGAKEQV